MADGVWRKAANSTATVLCYKHGLETFFAKLHLVLKDENKGLGTSNISSLAR